MVIQESDLSQKEIRNFVDNAPDSETFEISVKYDILDQVSSQLYNNPRRAIEELVCNSYDAAATECYVSTPNDNQGCLQVLDNGVSMDEKELEDLWNVAGGKKRRKEKEGKERTISKETVKERRQIGKFGVGKLAAYALGDRLIHVATKNGKTRIISVKKDNIENNSTENPPEAEIYEMSEDKARDYLENYLNDIPDPWKKDWDSWTLAIVDEVNEDAAGKSLKPQYLDRMIKTAIPRSAKFIVYKNNKQIKPKSFPDEKYAEIENLAEDEKAIKRMEHKLKEFWKNEKQEFTDIDDVPSSKYEIKTEEIQPYEEGEETKAVIVPELGPVIAKGSIFKDIIRDRKLEDRNIHTIGFKVRVRGSIVNRGSPKFGTKDKNYQWFHRFRGIFEIPELDKELLVQRDSVKENQKTRLTRSVLHGFYNELSRRAEKVKDRDTYEPENFGNRIEGRSPNMATKALVGLYDSPEEMPEEGWDDVEVSVEDDKSESEAINFDKETIFINKEHPFFEHLDKAGVKENQIIAIGEGLSGSLLGRGYLRYKNISDSTIEDLLKLQDQALRAAADYLEDPVKFLKDDLEERSRETGTPFEKSVMEALEYLGADVKRFGGSGESDLIVSIDRTADDPLRISVEVKGKQGDKKADHTDIKKGNVENHMDEDDCSKALAIAREFQLEGNGDPNSKLIKQFGDNEDLSLLNLECLKRMLDVHSEKGIDRRCLINILTHQKKPNEINKIFEDAWEEDKVPPNVTEKVIRKAHEIHEEETEVEPHFNQIYQELKEEVSRDQVKIALEHAMSTTHMVTLDDNGQFGIYQKPEKILSHSRQ